MQLATPHYVFAGGGSGGHLYPALGVVRALRELTPEAVFVFLATRRAIDARVLEGTGCELVGQTVRPMRMAPWTWPGMVRSMAHSRRLARDRFVRQRPAIVVGTGGFASVPGVLEARRAGIPTALLNPDARPGKANRFLGRRVQCVFAQWGETVSAFPPSARVEVLGCPVRPEFGRADRAAGCAAFELDATRRTILITGASQGARSINEAVIGLFDLFRAQPDWQILHLTGDADFVEVQTAYESARVSVKVLAYTHQMPLALAAADLVIARAGASTLAEITAAGRASVLLPYPHHRDQHQRANAMCLVRAGAAAIVDDLCDSVANARGLRPVLEMLLQVDAERHRMAEAARAMGRPNAACEIARRLLELAGISAPDGTAESLKQTCMAGR